MKKASRIINSDEDIWIKKNESCRYVRKNASFQLLEDIVQSQHNSSKLASLFVLLFLFAGKAMANEDAGILKARFIYQGEAPPSLQAFCPQGVPAAPVALAGIATEIVVSLAGKAVESIIDAAAARTQPEATTLDVVLPLDGYYNENGEIAVANGCLIFHNASNPDLSDATMLGSFVLIPSYDRTAFKFRVYQWRFNNFFKPQSSHWFQEKSVRDFALRIEFLTPGTADKGARSVFVEQIFPAVSVGRLNSAFSQGDDLPWFSAPTKPSGLPVTILTGDPKARYLPLNIRVTAVETTRPNQLAQWTQDLAKEKKADISNAFKDIVRESIDKSYAAGNQIKNSDTAAVAYTAYKLAWDEAALHQGAKPTAPTAGANQATTDKFNADTQAWKAILTVKVQGVGAKRVLARSAFSSADLSWPGDLPLISEN